MMERCELETDMHKLSPDSNSLRRIKYISTFTRCCGGLEKRLWIYSSEIQWLSCECFGMVVEVKKLGINNAWWEDGGDSSEFPFTSAFPEKVVSCLFAYA